MIAATPAGIWPAGCQRVCSQRHQGTSVHRIAPDHVVVCHPPFRLSERCYANGFTQPKEYNGYKAYWNDGCQLTALS
jgi:hypothetical protein